MSEILQVRDLRVQYEIGGGLWRSGKVVRAVDGLDLTLRAGETLALVGESGCGKTTVARALLGLTRMASGSIRLEGQEQADMLAADPLAYRRLIQMVFQDPFESLNPRKTVLDTLAQPLRLLRQVPRAALRQEAAQLLDQVGLGPGAHFLDRFPHQFSGGQRQRLCIARALAGRPRILVADEPVSALDVSIRAQILSLFQELARQYRLATVFITHDLGIVRSLCDRVAVMYLGRIVEEGPTDQVFDLPRHPYTAALLAASPIADPVLARQPRPAPISGDVPSPTNPPAGCRFHPRCPHVRDRCRTEHPPLAVQGPGRVAACHFAAEAEKWVAA